MKTKGILVLYDENKKETKRISLLKAPFKEDIIKKTSLEMFNEEEPCIIYKTICINKLGIDMNDNLNELGIKPDEIFDISYKGLCEKLNFPSEVKYMSFI